MEASTQTISAPSSNWTIDASHSGVHFSVRHMMITNVRGEFQKLSGSVRYDAKRPEQLEIRASIDAASINTREPQRDGHLRSADFLDVEQYPQLTFVSRSTKLKSGGDLEVTGDLTIHGVTRPVVLHVDTPTPESKDPFGNVRVGASATTKIKRSDFGMTWNSVIEAGGVLVGDEVAITLDISLIKQG